jgi:hypothetical protein
MNTRKEPAVSHRRSYSIGPVLLGLVLAVSTLGDPAAHAGPPPYRVTIHASATTVQAGQLITFTGKVRPATRAARKQNVKLQVTYPNGVSETASLDRPNRQGRYAFTESFGAPGDYRIRARIAAGKGHAEGISDELKITVVPLSVP